MKTLLVAAVVAAVTASAANERPRIELTAVTSFAQHARQPDGRAGDVELVRWSLRDRHGRLVGNANLDCHWHNNQRRMCFGELRLPLGKIVVVGSSQTRARGELPVVGGTGAYEDAEGVLVFRETGQRRLTISVGL